MGPWEPDLTPKILTRRLALPATLRDEAVSGGYLTNEEFDQYVRPENMISPG